MKNIKKDTDINLYIGKRLRLRCKTLKMSQGKCGEFINCAFQQIQKYMSGGNRISAGNLHLLSIALNVPITYFFEDLPGYKTLKNDPMQSNEVINLVIAFNKIESPELKAAVYSLVAGLK